MRMVSPSADSALWSRGSQAVSNGRRFHRCYYERPQKIHQVVRAKRLELLETPRIAVLKRTTSLYVYNKIDSVSLDFLDKLAREPDTVVMSCELDLGIQDVVERCWHELQLLRIYTKRWVQI